MEGIIFQRPPRDIRSPSGELNKRRRAEVCWSYRRWRRTASGCVTPSRPDAWLKRQRHVPNHAMTASVSYKYAPHYLLSIYTRGCHLVATTHYQLLEIQGRIHQRWCNRWLSDIRNATSVQRQGCMQEATSWAVPHIYMHVKWYDNLAICNCNKHLSLNSDLSIC